MKEKKEINVTIGSRIKNARESAGLTQQRFAELVQLDAKNISAVERGTVGVSISSIQRICEVLNISSDILLFEPIAENDEIKFLSDRLSRLTPAQFSIAKDILNRLMEGFNLNK